MESNKQFDLLDYPDIIKSLIEEEEEHKKLNRWLP
jgi:hypothetical protein